jgi:hypothetical protein
MIRDGVGVGDRNQKTRITLRGLNPTIFFNAAAADEMSPRPKAAQVLLTVPPLK